MNVLIIEDEARAANHLQRLITEVAPEMNIVGIFETVRESINYLNKNHSLALIFSDIQLADGLSFEIFKKVKVTCPIIFTTAYDKYAIDAFNTNGIDYLLKPIEEARLQQSINKAKQLANKIDVNALLNIAGLAPQKTFKERFLIKVGDKIKSIAITDIKAFYTFEKANYLLTLAGKSYLIDYSLDEISNLIDSKNYFKISRKFIVSHEACENIIAWSNSRLKITINEITHEPIIVAREKVQEFKQWLDR